MALLWHTRSLDCWRNELFKAFLSALEPLSVTIVYEGSDSSLMEFFSAAVALVGPVEKLVETKALTRQSE